MTTGVIGTAGTHVSNTSQDVFIPELWSDDVIAAYKTNLVLAQYVTKIGHKGKKGDTLHIPVPTRGSVSAKSTEQQVQVQSNVETKVSISIENLAQLYKVNKITKSRLISAYKRVISLGLKKPMLSWIHKKEEIIRMKLIGNRAGLITLQFYKLGLFVREMEK